MLEIMASGFIGFVCGIVSTVALMIVIRWFDESSA
jgi:tetrahydromethanopterin S-methyltransferase subunit F